MKNNIIAAGILALSLSSVFATSSAHAGLSSTFINDTTAEIDIAGPGNVFGDPNLSVSPLNVTFASTDNMGNPIAKTQNLSAGLFRLTETQNTNDFIAFCVQLDQTISFATDYTINNALFAGMKLDRLQKLFNTYFPEVVDPNNTAVMAAGFQVAIWEIVSDATLDLSDGEFTLNENSTNSVRVQAQDFLDGLDSLTSMDYEVNLNLSFITSSLSQDFIVWDDELDSSVVSAPASAILLVLGFGGLVAAKRKKA